MMMKKDLMNMITGRPASGLEDWFREGGCPLSVKARFWPNSPWLAFRRSRRAG